MHANGNAVLFLLYLFMKAMVAFILFFGTLYRSVSNRNEITKVSVSIEQKRNNEGFALHAWCIINTVSKVTSNHVKLSAA